MPSAPKPTVTATPPPTEQVKPLGSPESAAKTGLAQLRLATRNPLAAAPSRGNGLTLG